MLQKTANIILIKIIKIQHGSKGYGTRKKDIEEEAQMTYFFPSSPLIQLDPLHKPN